MEFRLEVMAVLAVWTVVATTCARLDWRMARSFGCSMLSSRPGTGVAETAATKVRREKNFIVSV